eukprot:s2626_g2.t1
MNGWEPPKSSLHMRLTPFDRFAMRVTLVMVVWAARGAPADWMERNFQQLQHKTLLQMTLPGSHNSGNYQGGLHADLLCQSDYRYNEYLASESSRMLQTSGRSVFSQSEFDQRMIPWNVNHFHPIRAQLREDGVRFLHLKLCNFGAPGAPTMDLATLRFQHRGYTTRETVASTIEDLQEFLREYPKEIVVLGFNNLHNSGSKSFSKADIAALSVALETAIGEENLISHQQLLTQTLGDLVAAGRRLAVFVQGAEPGSHIIPSQLALDENWSPVMDSGDLAKGALWLLQDLQGSKRMERFYVMQANPNNAESKIYESMNSNQLPASNLDFLRGFLQDLQGLVLAAAHAEPDLQINVIDTDFLNISQPYATAMQLMGLPNVSPLNSDAPSSSWWLGLTALCGLCGCLLLISCQRHCQRRLATL